MGAIETIPYRGFDIEVHVDETPMNPWEDMDHLTVLVQFSGNRRGLHLHADETPPGSAEEWLREDLCNNEPMGVDVEELVERGRELDEEFPRPLGEVGQFMQIANEKVDKLVAEHLEKNYVFLTIGYFNNSGLSLHDRTPGDGDGACAYITLETAVDNWGVPKDSDWDARIPDWGDNKGKTITLREAARRCMEAELEEYSNYLCGKCYGWTVERDDLDIDESCWGYYGDDHEASGLLDAARGAIDWHVNNIISKHAKRLKGWLRNRVPLGYREPLTI